MKISSIFLNFPQITSNYLKFPQMHFPMIACMHARDEKKKIEGGMNGKNKRNDFKR
jgi:hypothetical protein